MAAACNQAGQADWPALQANYAYLMDYDLIECCRTVHGELSWEQEKAHLLQLSQLKRNASAAAAAATNAIDDTSMDVDAVNQSLTCAVGCQTDAEITTAGNYLHCTCFCCCCCLALPRFLFIKFHLTRTS